jgi:hypothetical protein
MTTVAVAPAAVTAAEKGAARSPAVRALAELLVARLPQWEQMREQIQSALADPDQQAWGEAAEQWERANDRAWDALSDAQRRLYSVESRAAMRLDDIVTGHRVLALLGKLLGE